MPPFEGILNQEAMWAIKAYLETRREKPLESRRRPTHGDTSNAEDTAPGIAR